MNTLHVFSFTCQNKTLIMASVTPTVSTSTEDTTTSSGRRLIDNTSTSTRLDTNTNTNNNIPPQQCISPNKTTNHQNKLLFDNPNKSQDPQQQQNATKNHCNNTNRNNSRSSNSKNRKNFNGRRRRQQPQKQQQINQPVSCVAQVSDSLPNGMEEKVGDCDDVHSIQYIQQQQKSTRKNQHHKCTNRRRDNINDIIKRTNQLSIIQSPLPKTAPAVQVVENVDVVDVQYNACSNSVVSTNTSINAHTAVEKVKTTIENEVTKLYPYYHDQTNPYYNNQPVTYSNVNNINNNNKSFKNQRYVKQSKNNNNNHQRYHNKDKNESYHQQQQQLAGDYKKVKTNLASSSSLTAIDSTLVGVSNRKFISYNRNIESQQQQERRTTTTGRYSRSNNNNNKYNHMIDESTTTNTETVMLSRRQQQQGNIKYHRKQNNNASSHTVFFPSTLITRTTTTSTNMTSTTAFEEKDNTIYDETFPSLLKIQKQQQQESSVCHHHQQQDGCTTNKTTTSSSSPSMQSNSWKNIASKIPTNVPIDAMTSYTSNGFQQQQQQRLPIASTHPLPGVSTPGLVFLSKQQSRPIVLNSNRTKYFSFYNDDYHKTDDDDDDDNDNDHNDDKSKESQYSLCDNAEKTSLSEQDKTVKSLYPKLTIRSSTRVDMNKLRDRWWFLLKKHHDETVVAATAATTAASITVTELNNSNEILSNDCDPTAANTIESIERKADSEGGATNYYTQVTQQQLPMHGVNVAKKERTAINNKSQTICSGETSTYTNSNIFDYVYQNDIQAMESIVDKIYNKDELIQCLIVPPTGTTNYDSYTTRHNLNNITYDVGRLGILNLSVHLNRINILHSILRSLRRYNIDWYHVIIQQSSMSTSADNMASSTDQAFVQSPIFIAVQLGYEECIDVLFRSLYSTPDLNVLQMKSNSDGNTPIHCACYKSVPISTFELLVEVAVKAAGGRSSTGMNASAISQLFKVLSTKNRLMQETPLHIACTYGRVDIIDFVLSRIRNISVVSKLLLMQDISNQTPLLAAISSSSIDVVMSLLMWRGNNNVTVNQRYRSAIDSNLNPIATVNLNLSYNTINDPGLTAKTTSPSTSLTTPPCPLWWAVTKSNCISMVQLLMEFNNPVGDHGYDLDLALFAATQKRLDSFTRNNQCHTKPTPYSENKYKNSVDDELEEDVSGLEMIRILVEAGGNPCSLPTDSEKRTTVVGGSVPVISAVAAAAGTGDSECLTLLLNIYCERLKRIQVGRRRDPQLHKQPDSFFLQIETPENEEIQISVRDALVTSLFKYWEALVSLRPSSYNDIDQPRRDDNAAKTFSRCALNLFRHGTSLLVDDLNRLQESMNRKMLLPVAKQDISSLWTNPEYHAVEVAECANFERNDEASLEASSYALFQQPWFPLHARSSISEGENTNAGCDLIELYIRDEVSMMNSSAMTIDVQSPQSAMGQPDVVLVSSDGAHYPVHSTIVSKKSQKLAAAVRFSSLSSSHMNNAIQATTDNNVKHTLITVSVGIPRKQLRWMLEHIYHGSIVVGRFGNRRSTFDYYENLTELLFVADEFVCPTLVQECEMRLLATDYRRCFCWFCNKPAPNIFYSYDESMASSTCTTAALSNVTRRSYMTSGPSVLVKPEDALSILALSQQVGVDEESSLNENIGSYTIVQRKPEKLDTDMYFECRVDHKFLKRGPMQCLQEVAISTMLQNMAGLVKTDGSCFLLSLKYLIDPSQYIISDDELSIQDEEQIFECLLEILLKEIWKINNIQLSRK